MPDRERDVAETGAGGADACAAPEALRVVALRRRARISRAEWVRRIISEAGLDPRAAEFETRFVGHLQRLLREAGYHRAAAALQAAAADLADYPDERGEYDALVDMGLSLLVHRAEE